MVCEVLFGHVYRQIVQLLRFVKFYPSIEVLLNRLFQRLKDHNRVQGHVLHLFVAQYYQHQLMEFVPTVHFSFYDIY